MTKKQFLSELEAKLNILSDEEKEDIINEYKDIIEEKIRNGKTVKEAINDFGDIDELTEEILKAYKINPNYNKKENNQSDINNILVGLESVISKVSKKLASVTKQIFEEIKNGDNNLTMEKVFEVIIKFFILMIVLMFLRIPFNILYNMGVVILDFGNNPIGTIIYFSWRIIVWSIYFVSCLALVYVFIQTQLKNSDEENPIKKDKTKTTKVKKKDNVNLNEDLDKKKDKTNYVSNIMFVIRVFVGLTILLPLIFVNISLYIALAVVIYLLIKGIAVYGILTIIIGLIFIFSNVYSAFSNFIYSKKKTYLFPFIIGMILVTIGSLFTFDYISGIKYYDNLPSINANAKTVTYKEQIKDDLIIRRYNNNVKLLVNNELADNEVVIDATYYTDYVSIDKISYQVSNSETTIVEIYNSNRTGYKKVINDFLKQLEKHEMYNYQSLFDIDVEVYANENTISKINKDW